MSNRILKASNQFILRQIAGDNLLIPVGAAANQTKGLILLSESGMLLYEKLKHGCTKEALVAALLAEYDVTEDEARADTDAFLEQMRQLNMLVECE